MASGIVLGRCINPKCTFGCAAFFCPTDPESLLSASQRLGQRCLCACYGNQHAKETSGPDIMPAPVTQSAPPPPSASASTGPQSHAPHVPLNSFSDAARLAKERVDKLAMENARYQAAFDTSTQHAAPGLSGRKKKGAGSSKSKRARSDSPTNISGNKKANTASTKGSSSRVPRPPKLSASQKCDFLVSFLPETNRIYEEGNPGVDQPSPQDLRALQLAGHVVTVYADANMSPREIDRHFRSALARCAFMKGDITKLEGWKVLLKVDQGKGKRALLKLFALANGEDLSYTDLYSMRVPYHRQGQTRSEFKNILYIAGPKSAGTIEVPGYRKVESEGEESGSEESGDGGDDGEGDEESEGEAGESNATDSDVDEKLDHGGGAAETVTPDENRKSKDESKLRASSAEQSETEPDTPEKLDSSSFVLAHRLSYNLRGAKGNFWWPEPPHTYPYSLAFRRLDGMLHPALAAFKKDPSPATLQDLRSALSKFIPSLAFLIELDDALSEPSAEANSNIEFEEVFRLGPAGLEPLIAMGHRLYHFLKMSGAVEAVGLKACNEIIAVLEPSGLAILNLIKLFRDGVDRSNFDPPGFADLRQVLNSQVSYFKDATEAQTLRIFDLSFDTATVEDFKDALIADFGSLVEPSKIPDDALLLGCYGIHGLIDVFDYLLDELPLDHILHDDLYDVFQPFAMTLSRKISNFKKSYTKKKGKATKKAEGPAPSGPRTRRQQQQQDGEEEAGKEPSGSKAEPMVISDDDHCDHSGPIVISDDSEIEWTESVKEAMFGKPGARAGASSGRAPYPSVNEKYRKEEVPIPPKPLACDTGKPKPKPKPKPKKIARGEFQLPNVEILAEIRRLASAKNVNRMVLLQTVLRRMPHPNVKRRRVWDDVKDTTPERTWKKMQLIYHPDKNGHDTTLAPGTLELFTSIVQLVNHAIMV
ncbi:hypothetical protein DFP72DRAFT_854382 [Ephemerocybe angulata]|uniref:Uncharacterized protein n=1 Tax=Ephemerocybe angulata TaxID=980116 RepID=A0A8H6HI00_9AGAR|nr:hypothetical protein DFP72DRAFT_854382 [Tulosesus angulatus]